MPRYQITITTENIPDGFVAGNTSSWIAHCLSEKGIKILPCNVEVEVLSLDFTLAPSHGEITGTFTDHLNVPFLQCSDFKKGDLVTYNPTNDVQHKEDGVVSSVDYGYVFVRYSDGDTAQASLPERLTKRGE